MKGRRKNKNGSLEDEIKEGKEMDGISMVTWRYAEVTVKKGLIKIGSRFREKSIIPKD